MLDRAIVEVDKILRIYSINLYPNVRILIIAFRMVNLAMQNVSILLV